MVEVNGKSYQARKMPPRLQFHVLRRLAPILSAAAPAIGAFLEEEQTEDGDKKLIASVLLAIGPLTEALGGMDDKPLDYVLDACLMHAERLDTDNKWHPIVANGGRMYQDIDGAGELRIAGEVIRENLSGFFAQLSDAAGPLLASLKGPQAAPS